MTTEVIYKKITIERIPHFNGAEDISRTEEDIDSKHICVLCSECENNESGVCRSVLNGVVLTDFGCNRGVKRNGLHCT